MNKLVPVSADIDVETVKDRPISKRLQKVLVLLADKGITQREAAKQGGMTEAWLSTALRKPQVQVFIARRARQNLQIGVLRASKRVLELVDADSEHVSLDASKHVLAIEGIKPQNEAQVSVNIDIKAGYVIDLTGDPRRTIDALPAQATIEHDATR